MRSVRQTHAEASADLWCPRAFQNKLGSCADTAEENLHKREGGQSPRLAVLRAAFGERYGPRLDGNDRSGSSCEEA